jgi:tetratricopeptide (TPR) repeat protein
MNRTDDAPPVPTSSHTETGAAPEAVTEPMPLTREPAATLRRTSMAFLGSAGEVDALSSEVTVADGPAPSELKGDLGRGYALLRKRLWARLEQRAPSQAAADAAGAATIRAELDQLRPSEREALVLRFLTGLDVGEIAAVCRSSAEEIQKRLSRALSQLGGKSRGKTEACRKIESDAFLSVENKLSPALSEHLSDCDACRDLKHDLSGAVDRVRRAGDDVTESAALEQQLNQAIAAQATRTTAQPLAAPPDAPAVAVKAPGPRIVGLVVALGVAATLGLVALFGGKHPVGVLGERGARVERLSSVGDGPGLRACAESGDCERLARGDRIPNGSRIESDAVTRADIELNEGVRVLVDRNTAFVLSPEGKTAIELLRGMLVADVEEGEELGLTVRHGGGKLGPGTFNLRSAGDDTVIEVTRGGADLFGSNGPKTRAQAGEQVRLSQNGARVSTSSNPSGALTFSEKSDGDETTSRGLGELRAKKPGTDNELKGSVRLASHAVRVRIAGAVARTEIEEVFTNTTDQTLEGIYRFPLPPDAQIERLALDVDGKLLDGAFVDRDRAAAIWRGAIVNSAKNAPRPREEIVWVPGPWKDPALLEWQRGGRFELRIFPIPKQGARRIVLAYTQMLKPAGDVRRYVYPLAHDPSATTRVDHFSFDARVRGHDRALGVQTYGYDITRKDGGDALQLDMDRRDFVPSGDLIVEYGLTEPSAELKAWAYASSGITPPSTTGAGVIADATAAYVTLALRPELPRTADGARRAFAVVVDSSRSMFGESYTRARKLAGRIARELDPGDRVVVLACDTECRTAPGGLEKPGRDAEARVLGFLGGIEADGASDPARAVEAGYRALSERGERAARIVFIGDGAPTMGPTRPTELERAIAKILPKDAAQLTSVGVGVEADSDVLAALSRAGGGVSVAYAPGAPLTDAAHAVLGAAYGQALRDVEVELPSGLYAAAPERLDAVPAGGEVLLGARMSGSEVAGDVVLRGTLGGARFERRYPIRLTATSNEGNAFVPRQYAALRIRDLERKDDPEAKRTALALSSQFSVASRFTSLLVLESPAMFKAFGLDNQRTTPIWTGEEEAEGESVALADNQERALGRASAALDALSDDSFGAEPAPKAEASLEREVGSGGPRAKRSSREEDKDAYAAAPPAPAMTPPMPQKPGGSEPPRRRAQPNLAPGDPDGFWPGERPGFVPMRRIWERFGEVTDGRQIPAQANADAIARAERDAAQDPNRREAVRKLYVLLSLAGELDRAEHVVQGWVEKDPLDPEALTARADLAARRGDRERAIRLLGSVVDVRPGDVRAQRRLERLQRWAGRAALGCRHLVSAAELRRDDAALLADAARCSRDGGDSELAERLLAGAPALRTSAESLSRKSPDSDSQLAGDLRVEATWSSGADLDLSLLDPDGHRISWLGAPTKALIFARDATSPSGEGLSVRGAKPGDYVIEVVRQDPANKGEISGTIVVSAAGQVRRIPFRLDDARKSVGLVSIKTRSRLVPL